jgi:hypothetical protein
MSSINDPAEFVRSAKNSMLPLVKEREREKLAATFDALDPVLTGLNDTAKTVQTEDYWDDDPLIVATRLKYGLLVKQWEKLLPIFQAYVDAGLALKEPAADDPILIAAKIMDEFLANAQRIVIGTGRIHRFKLEHPLHPAHPLFESVHNTISNFSNYLSTVTVDLAFCNKKELGRKLTDLWLSSEVLSGILLSSQKLKRPSFEPILYSNQQRHLEKDYSDLFEFPATRAALIDWWNQHKEEINKIPATGTDADESTLTPYGYFNFIRKLVRELERTDIAELADVIAAHKAKGETIITAGLVQELSNVQVAQQRGR